MIQPIAGQAVSSAIIKLNIKLNPILAPRFLAVYRAGVPPEAALFIISDDSVAHCEFSFSRHGSPFPVFSLRIVR